MKNTKVHKVIKSHILWASLNNDAFFLQIQTVTFMSGMWGSVCVIVRMSGLARATYRSGVYTCLNNSNNLMVAFIPSV